MSGNIHVVVRPEDRNFHVDVKPVGMQGPPGPPGTFKIIGISNIQMIPPNSPLPAGIWIIPVNQVFKYVMPDGTERWPNLYLHFSDGVNIINDNPTNAVEAIQVIIE